MNIVQKRSEKPSTGPLRNLQYVRPGGTTRFPDNIEAIGHFMKISPLEKHKFEAELNSNPGASSLQERTDIIHSILLPMPSSLATNYAQTYDDSFAAGPLGAMIGASATVDKASDIATKVRQSFTGSDENKAAGRKGLKNIADGMIGNVKQEIKGAALNLGQGLIEENIGAVIGSRAGIGGALLGDQATRGAKAFFAGAGIARNPHMAVLYKNPNFRAFNFSWELRPRTYSESVSIGKIIHMLKFFSAPSFHNSTHMFKYPNQFSLSFKFPEFLFSMGTCILKNFGVDYHGEGTPLYYDAPVKGQRKIKPPAVVKISTEWQEISVLTKEGIEKRNR